jgi:membrane fusion protein
MNQPLFREEAVNYHQKGVVGETRLTSPVSFWVMAWGALAMSLGAVVFLTCVSYTQRTQVTGVLMPEGGMPKVMAQQAGVVAKLLVREGQEVAKGDPILVISSERNSSDGLATLETIQNNIVRRRQSAAEEIAKQRELTVMQAQGLQRKLRTMRSEVRQLEDEVAGQTRRVELATASVERFRQLTERKFAPQLQLQQREEELLDQQGRLASLKRGRDTLAREMESLAEESDSLQRRSEMQISQLERGVAAIDLESLEHGARRSAMVLAPENGVVAALLGQVGQNVAPGQPLFSIVPKGVPLVAHLFAPSKAVGFISEGRSVLLRYQPFSFQKFGQHEGHVAEVSRMVLQPSELPVPPPAGSTEAYYRIVVALKSQTIRAYGKDQPLQPGTLVEGTVLLDTRRLIEWVFEPLLTLTGSL